MTKQTAQYDVAVIGGGPAGTTASNRLARLGRSVVLLESSSYDSPRVGETLPPSICPILINLGIWESFQSLDPVRSYGTQSIWGDSEILSNPFMLSPFGSGWHVNRLGFDFMLAKKASESGVCVMTGVNVTICSWKPDDGWIIDFQTNKNEQVIDGTRVPSSHRLYSKCLIDATGRNSVLSKRLGANRSVYDHLSGIAVQFQMKADCEIGLFTLVEASEQGWWYSAPIPKCRLIVIFMTDLDLIRSHKPLNIKAWMEQLTSTKYTYSRCCRQQALWGPRIFSALSQRLNMPSTEAKWLATGDAAMAVNPLSSNGISHALISGAGVALAMDHWLSGDRSTSYTYENELDKEFEEYLRIRHNYYSMETRWPDATFWKRRQLLNV